MQAAIKKKVEKQKKRTNDQGGGVGDIQSAARNQKSKQLSPMTAAEAAEAAEDSETLEEQLEELMEGPRRREKEKDKDTESVDLMPIVDSVFGQVGVCYCTGDGHVRVYV